MLAFSYFFILVVPEDVHRPGLHPKTWIVPLEVAAVQEVSEFAISKKGRNIGVGKG